MRGQSHRFNCNPPIVYTLSGKRHDMKFGSHVSDYVMAIQPTGQLQRWLPMVKKHPYDWLILVVYGKPLINSSLTLWLFNIAVENCQLFVDDFPIKTSIYEGFSMAMLNNQRVVLGGHLIGLAESCCRGSIAEANSMYCTEDTEGLRGGQGMATFRLPDVGTYSSPPVKARKTTHALTHTHTDIYIYIHTYIIHYSQAGWP